MQDSTSKHKEEDPEKELKVTIRPMREEDYDKVIKLWKTISGFGIRTIDDAKDGVVRFLRRNPGISVVAQQEDGSIVGTVLCGHDGRQACFYHVCVKKELRRRGIATRMVKTVLDTLTAEHINRAYLIAFKSNEGGNEFWQRQGWSFKTDRNYYEMYLNQDNNTIFNQ